MTDNETIRQALEESARTKGDMISTCSKSLEAAAILIAEAMRNENKLLICGNGGSAADSQHIATEFVVRLTSESERRALPALALTTDTSTLTAAGNDFGFDQIFSRQVEAHGRPGDLLIAISTSGRSPNVIKACQAAGKRHIKVIALLGREKSEIGELADLCICIPSDNSQRVQEGHITAGHLLVSLVEKNLTESK